MLLPYLLTALVFTFVAFLAAAGASLVSMSLAGMLPALRWVRVHFIKIRIISQAIFGLLPLLVASLSKKPRPPTRGVLYGVGFPLYALALIRPVQELVDTARAGLRKYELA